MSETNTVFMRRSKLTGKQYDYFSKDIIRLLNLQQIAYLCDECDLIPIDVVLSEDRKRPGKKVVVYIFEKTPEFMEAFHEWQNREHNI